MIAVGFHEPKKLATYERSWKARALGTPSQETRLELMQRAQELIARRQLQSSKLPES